jgi:hypothetical protein
LSRGLVNIKSFLFTGPRDKHGVTGCLWPGDNAAGRD